MSSEQTNLFTGEGADFAEWSPWIKAGYTASKFMLYVSGILFYLLWFIYTVFQKIALAFDAATSWAKEKFYDVYYEVEENYSTYSEKKPATLSEAEGLFSCREKLDEEGSDLLRELHRKRVKKRLSERELTTGGAIKGFLVVLLKRLGATILNL